MGFTTVKTKAGSDIQEDLDMVRGIRDAVGDKLELIVSHCDPVVNLYDHMYATRKDRVEEVWPITARGMST